MTQKLSSLICTLKSLGLEKEASDLSSMTSDEFWSGLRHLENISECPEISRDVLENAFLDYAKSSGIGPIQILDIKWGQPFDKDPLYGFDVRYSSDDSSGNKQTDNCLLTRVPEYFGNTMRVIGDDKEIYYFYGEF